eukprot:199587_1
MIMQKKNNYPTYESSTAIINRIMNGQHIKKSGPKPSIRMHKELTQIEENNVKGDIDSFVEDNGQKWWYSITMQQDGRRPGKSKNKTQPALWTTKGKATKWLKEEALRFKNGVPTVNYFTK